MDLARKNTFRLVPGVVLLSVLPMVAAGAQTASPTGSAELLSRSSGDAGAKGDGLSRRPAASADGRFVVFESAAANLDPSDTDTTVDVFVRDRRTGSTTLVSRATGADGSKGNGDSTGAVISADGKRIVFTTRATNFDPVDTDGFVDVYLRDLATSTTTLLSRRTGVDGSKAGGNSSNMALSADGAAVAFVTSEPLDSADSDATIDVYLRSIDTAATTLVSRADGVSGDKGNGGSITAGISGDGRHVAFSSLASNLHPDDPDTRFDVYIRDVVAGTTTLASRATGPAGRKAGGDSVANTFEGALSGDGQRVVFATTATNLDSVDDDPDRDVYVRDIAAGTTTLVSRATGPDGPKGNAESSRAEISLDGTVVSFGTLASNLDPDDTDTEVDAYVRDLGSAVTTLVSRADGDGPKGNGASPFRRVSLSGDGRYVVFDSLASNLDWADTDDVSDVFVRTLYQPEVVGIDRARARRGQTLVVTVTGRGFTATPDVSFGPGITVGSVRFLSTRSLEVVLSVARDADAGLRTVTVTNPAGDTATRPVVEVLRCVTPPKAPRPLPDCAPPA